MAVCVAMDRDPDLSEPRYHNVLVAFDGSPESWLALGHAVALSHFQGARLTLLTVIPETPPMIGPTPVGREQLAAELQEEMESVLARARDRVPQDVSITTIMRTGDAPSAICKVAHEQNCDAIMLGSRGRGRIGALLGSVSQAVMHKATTNVIVVHAPRPG